jgi:hypothetical protein
VQKLNVRLQDGTISAADIPTMGELSDVSAVRAEERNEPKLLPASADPIPLRI